MGRDREMAWVGLWEGNVRMGHSDKMEERKKGRSKTSKT